MNPGIKQQWINALRSDEYEQGKGALRREGKFCCLGVLTDLAAKDGVVEWEGDQVRDGYGNLNDGTLAPQVMEWCGLGSDNPELGSGVASAWNDENGADFNEIADLIEAYL